MFPFAFPLYEVSLKLFSWSTNLSRGQPFLLLGGTKDLKNARIMQGLINELRRLFEKYKK